MSLSVQSAANDNYAVRLAVRGEFEWLLLHHHYARRIPSISYAFGLWSGDTLIGVITFGTPASRQIQVGACPESPSSVIELNRLCVLDQAPSNTESWFIARALKLLPPHIVVSYADTVQGHFGFVYRAANFNYAGWTDMERKTPRYDYVVEGKHSRDAFRGGVPQFSQRVRRRPKVKYWITTGTKRDRRRLETACCWQTLDWKIYPPPAEHRQFVALNDNVSQAVSSLPLSDEQAPARGPSAAP